MIDSGTRYLQLAFNDDVMTAARIVTTLPKDPRILIEAGTPLIKREGLKGISMLRAVWPYGLVADLKTCDGGAEEVAMVAAAGATAATVMGSSPPETLNLFVEACHQRGVDALVDMLGVEDPLRRLRHLRTPPAGVVLHLGRDEESTRGKMIQYRHVSRIRSKLDVAVSAAGGVDLKAAGSAVFNGASIVVVNIVPPGKPWGGIPATGEVAKIAQQFLTTIA